MNNSNHPKLLIYFKRFESIYPKSMKDEIFSCPTTCCWVNMHRGTEWRHIQYFLVLEILLAYDLSSDIFKNKETQLVSTFYAGLLHHLTSRLI